MLLLTLLVIASLGVNLYLTISHNNKVKRLLNRYDEGETARGRAVDQRLDKIESHGAAFRAKMIEKLDTRISDVERELSKIRIGDTDAPLKSSKTRRSKR